MKLLFLLLISFRCFSQTEVGLAAGGSNKNIVVNLQVGHDFGFHHIYYNQIIHLTNVATSPDILGLRYSYWIKGFEPSVGVDYHLLSDTKENEGKRGWRLGYGLAYKFEKMFLSVGASGGVYYLMAGIYKNL